MSQRKFSGLHLDLSREKKEYMDLQVARFPASLVMEHMSEYGWSSWEGFWDSDFGPTPGTI